MRTRPPSAPSGGEGPGCGGVPLRVSKVLVGRAALVLLQWVDHNSHRRGSLAVQPGGEESKPTGQDRGHQRVGLGTPLSRVVWEELPAHPWLGTPLAPLSHGCKAQVVKSNHGLAWEPFRVSQLPVPL